ncbi:MAG: nicotinamide mononucleotide transporter [Bacteroidia bacterium]|nr:nicotinamide mononucleotide transporter [Bacteroidia bacterium]
MLNILEIGSVAFVLFYLFYATKQKSIAWIFGCISSALSFVLFYQLELFGSAILQIFYFLLGVNGFLNWSYFESDRKASYRYSKTFHLVSILLILILIFLINNLSAISWGPDLSILNFLDVSLAILSIWATYLETKKDIVCWWYWIACNIGYGILYLYQSYDGESLFLYSALMFFLAGFSYFAKITWQKSLRNENQLQSNPNKN